MMNSVPAPISNAEEALECSKNATPTDPNPIPRMNIPILSTQARPLGDNGLQNASAREKTKTSHANPADAKRNQLSSRKIVPPAPKPRAANPT
jgi:hypothetical protein